MDKEYEINLNLTVKELASVWTAVLILKDLYHREPQDSSLFEGLEAAEEKIKKALKEQ